MIAQMELPLTATTSAIAPIWLPLIQRISTLNMDIAAALGDGNFTRATILNRQLAEQVWALRDITCHLRPAN